MSPVRRAKLLNLGRWTCLSAALALTALTIAANWYWLKCWGTIHGYRLSAGVERSDAYIFLSKDWPELTPHPKWCLAAEPRLSYAYSWWDWNWPWRTLTSGPAWFRQFAFPVYLPIPILVAAAALLWRSHAKARAALTTTACPSCSYDRQGLTPTTPCPECGTIPQ